MRLILTQIQLSKQDAICSMTSRDVVTDLAQAFRIWRPVINAAAKINCRDCAAATLSVVPDAGTCVPST